MDTWAPETTRPLCLRIDTQVNTTPPTTIRALFDTGSHISTVSKQLTDDLNLDIDSSQKIPARTFTGEPIETYGTACVDLTMTDSFGIKKRAKYILQVAATDAEEILLGYDWIYIARPEVKLDEHRWWWPLEYNHVELVDSSEIDHEVRQGARVFACYYDPFTQTDSSLIVLDPTTPRINAVSTDPPAEPTVPSHLSDFADVFSAEAAGRLPEHGRLDHAIDIVPGKEVPYGPLYNLSPPELEVLRKYIDDATEKGWIRRSTSPAGAPVLFVPKKDGGLRLCVDYRGLNNVTIKNRHPLPLISETLDRLGGSVIFTKLDLKDAYHRIRIKKGDEWKTAFRTRYGHFEYLVMPFGLANAPATFQAYISQALVGLVDTVCVIYLDDILIYSADRKRHHDDVKAVLERLRAYKLYAGLKKCEFDKTEVSFLGFTINTAGIGMETSRVDTIADWPEPKSFHDLQVFLGFANFYRRFIEGYSRVVKPLTDMLKGMQAGRKHGPFEWTESQKTAFAALKARFTAQPMLRHFNPALPIVVETDASDFAIGAILSQQHVTSGTTTDQHWHPVAYYSRKMIDAETRYPTHDGEMLAIVAAFKQWRHYLEGAQHTVIVRTDHDSLKYFMTKKELNRRQARWAERLASFDFTIEYRQGKTNPADGLSRRPDYESTTNHAEALLPTLQSKMGNLFMIGFYDDATNPPRAQPETDPTQAHSWSHSSATAAFDQWKTETAFPDEGGTLETAIVLDQEPPLATTAIKHERTEEPLSLLEVPERAPERNTSVPIFRLQLDDHQADAPPLDWASIEGTLEQENVTIFDDDEEPAGITWEDIQRQQVVPRWVAIRALHPDPQRRSSGLDKLAMPMKDVLKGAQKLDAFCAEKRYLTSKGRERPEMFAVDKEGLLRFKGRAYVPPDAALRQEILRTCHDDPHSSHFGTLKTLHLIKRYYYWATMAEDTKEYVKTCHICQRTKTSRHLKYGTLQSLPMPKGPWMEITMDFVTDLPPSPEGAPTELRDSILVIVDRFTKMALYIPTVKTLTAEALADVFVERVARRFGLPEGIVSDRGSVFTSKFWSTLCFHLKIKRRLSTAFHPQTDGQTERQNQTLEHYLRCYCNYRQDDWVARLAMAEFTYNNSVHATTGQTPFFLLYGFHPSMRLHPENPTTGDGTDVPEAKLRAERLRTQREDLKARWDRAVASYEKFHNRRHIPITFKIGDMVMLSAKNIRQTRPTKKFSDRQLGPFKVIAIVGDHKQAYKLELPATWRIHPVFHVSLLEPYHGRPGSDAVPEPVEIDADGDEHWEVEAVLADRSSKNRGTEYLVRWKDFSPAHDSWEPRSMFDDPKILEQYHKEREATLGQPPNKKTKP